MSLVPSDAGSCHLSGQCPGLQLNASITSSSRLSVAHVDKLSHFPLTTLEVILLLVAGHLKVTRWTASALLYCTATNPCSILQCHGWMQSAAPPISS